MAINLGNAEDIPEDMQKVQEKMEIERQRQQEFLKPFLERFCEHVKCRMLSMPVEAEIDRYIQEENNIEGAIATLCCKLRDIKGTESGDEELYVFMDDFLEQTFYLHCAMELEYKKQEELKKQEEERLQELGDLEAAKPIFDMLKNEVQKWEWGDDFDEFTISKYIEEMVGLGKKHNVDLGIKENDVQEITTTYATELEALEEKEDK